MPDLGRPPNDGAEQIFAKLGKLTQKIAGEIVGRARREVDQVRSFSAAMNSMVSRTVSP
ncbi:hypothetical protein ACVWXQ_001329 [Bradyrhizobium sp. S3.14.4]